MKLEKLVSFFQSKFIGTNFYSSILFNSHDILTRIIYDSHYLGLEYCESAPQFAPPYLDRKALADDFKVTEQLTPLFRTIKAINNGLDDTIMQAGGEAYSNALSYYNSVKQAAKMNVPGAKSIYDDLSKRFEKSKPAKVNLVQPVV